MNIFIKEVNFHIPKENVEQARLALIREDEDLEKEDNLQLVMDWYELDCTTALNGDRIIQEVKEYHLTALQGLVYLAPSAKDGSYAWVAYAGDNIGDDIHELLYVKDGHIDEIVMTPDEIFKLMMRKAKKE